MTADENWSGEALFHFCFLRVRCVVHTHRYHATFGFIVRKSCDKNLAQKISSDRRAARHGTIYGRLMPIELMVEIAILDELPRQISGRVLGPIRRVQFSAPRCDRVSLTEQSLLH